MQLTQQQQVFCMVISLLKTPVLASTSAELDLVETAPGGAGVARSGLGGFDSLQWLQQQRRQRRQGQQQWEHADSSVLAVRGLHSWWHCSSRRPAATALCGFLLLLLLLLLVIQQ